MVTWRPLSASVRRLVENYLPATPGGWRSRNRSAVPRRGNGPPVATWPGVAARTSGRRSGPGDWVAGWDRPRGAEAEAAGQQALRDLAAGPGHIAHVRRWLRPEYFARGQDGDLFAVMRDLDAVGRPVDPVTVTWEAARRGIQADPDQFVGGNAPFAVASARRCAGMACSRM